jgi:hypothetical protein
MVASWTSVSVVRDVFAHGSDEAQEAELVVELTHGSEPHGLELAVVCRLTAFISRVAKDRLGKLKNLSLSPHQPKPHPQPVAASSSLAFRLCVGRVWLGRSELTEDAEMSTHVGCSTIVETAWA